MDRLTARELLPLYCDGELDAETSAELEAALARSPSLREELQRWKALRRCAQRTLGADPVPPDLERRVRTVIALEHQRRSRRRILTLLGVSGVAALVGLSLWLRPALNGGSPAMPAGPEIVRPEAFAGAYRRCGLHAHRQFLLTAPRIDSARAQLAGALRFTPAVPDLSPQGYDLVGCCTCLKVHGSAAAHVHYRSRGGRSHVVSVFSLKCHAHLRPGMPCCDAGKGGCLEEAMVGDVAVVKWCGSGRTYAVASDLDLAELQSLARQVRIAQRIHVPLSVALGLAVNPTGLP